MIFWGLLQGFILGDVYDGYRSYLWLLSAGAFKNRRSARQLFKQTGDEEVNFQQK